MRILLMAIFIITFVACVLGFGIIPLAGLAVYGIARLAARDHDRRNHPGGQVR